MDTQFVDYVLEATDLVITSPPSDFFVSYGVGYCSLHLRAKTQKVLE